MPTLGWIFEDDFERWTANNEVVPSPHSDIAHLNHRCPFCSEVFHSSTSLGAHLSSRHVGSRPFLSINGFEPPRQSTINRQPDPSQIAVANCTGAEVSIDGGCWRPTSTGELIQQLASLSHARLRVRLINRFEATAVPLATEYDLQYRVIASDELTRADQLFVAHLGKPAPRVSDIDRYLQTIGQGPVLDYAGALGEYVLAVLTKDRAPNTGIRRAGAEYRGMSNNALRILQSFNRPLPRLLCSLMRFGANDFSRPNEPVGFPPLHRANGVLTALASSVPVAVSARSEDASRARVDVCPIDAGTDIVLRRSDQLAALPRWAAAIEDQLRAESDQASLDPLDRVKLQALWAYTALRLGNIAGAEEPLRRLDGNDCFGAWAAERMKEHEL